MYRNNSGIKGNVYTVTLPWHVHSCYFARHRAVDPGRLHAITVSWVCTNVQSVLRTYTFIALKVAILEKNIAKLHQYNALSKVIFTENIEIQPEPRFRGYSNEYFEYIQTPPLIPTIYTVARKGHWWKRVISYEGIINSPAAISPKILSGHFFCSPSLLGSFFQIHPVSGKIYTRKCRCIAQLNIDC